MSSDQGRKIGEALARLRVALGKTQAEVATDLRTHHQNISDWERGKFVPRVAMLVRLADYYRVSLDDITNRSKTWQSTGTHAEKA